MLTSLSYFGLLTINPERGDSVVGDSKLLLQRKESFTGKYATRNIHTLYIRDPSGVFSKSPLVRILITSFPAQTVCTNGCLCKQLVKKWRAIKICLYNKTKITL